MGPVAKYGTGLINREKRWVSPSSLGWGSHSNAKTLRLIEVFFVSL